MGFDELRALLARHVRDDATTDIAGLHIARADRAGPPTASMSGTVLAVLAQGAKRLALGDRLYEYRPGTYFVASVDLPVTGHFTEIGPDHPALGLALVLEPTAIAELLLRAGPGDLPRPAPAAPPGIAVGEMSPELLDALIRLVRLLERPRDRGVLAPMVIREILWRLITADQGGVVRQLGLADSSLSHIARAVRWIREHYAEPFRVEDLARRTGMSPSAFYRNFQAVAAMSPIQFQKQIRLQEARLLLAAHPHDITGVGHRVGYDSPSQFSREYRRRFGVPPSQDAAHLHGRAGTAATALP
ncbi:AraC family transcriptional regulator N-terminal domain-containing protein [Streptomyces sp. NPDC088354]|uniref:AraC family transcriptional regulator n=1 Tax=Streptomyces sp. NPDC088354 TaxID=3365856 RepID=UPI0037F4A1E3